MFLISICDTAILRYRGTLKSVPDCYKNQEMCNKAVCNCLHTLEIVSDLKNLSIVILLQ